MELHRRFTTIRVLSWMLLTATIFITLFVVAKAPVEEWTYPTNMAIRSFDVRSDGTFLLHFSNAPHNYIGQFNNSDCASFAEVNYSFGGAIYAAYNDDGDVLIYHGRDKSSYILDTQGNLHDVDGVADAFIERKTMVPNILESGVLEVKQGNQCYGIKKHSILGSIFLEKGYEVFVESDDGYNILWSDQGVLVRGVVAFNLMILVFFFSLTGTILQIIFARKGLLSKMMAKKTVVPGIGFALSMWLYLVWASHDLRPIFWPGFACVFLVVVLVFQVLSCCWYCVRFAKKIGNS